jgi:hypothetical protein
LTPREPQPSAIMLGLALDAGPAELLEAVERGG